MNSQEEIRKTMDLLESINNGATKTLNEGFLDFDIGGTTIPKIIHAETQGMSNNDKLAWVGKVLLTMFEGHEIGQFAQGLLNAIHPDNQSLEESDEQAPPEPYQGFTQSMSQMTPEEIADWGARAAAGGVEGIELAHAFLDFIHGKSS